MPIDDDDGDLLGWARDPNSPRQREALGELIIRRSDVIRKNIKVPQKLRAVVHDEDVFGEIVVRIMQGIFAYKGDSAGQLSAWMATCAARTASENIRTLTAQKRMPVDATVGGIEGLKSLIEKGGRSPSREASHNERVAYLMEAIDRLPPRHATVVRMRALEEVSFKEVANKLECSHAWARTLFARSLEILRDDLDAGGIQLSSAQ